MSPKLTFEEQVLFEQIAADFDKSSPRLKSLGGLARIFATMIGASIATAGMMIFVHTTIVAFVFSVGAAGMFALTLNHPIARRLGRRLRDRFSGRPATKPRRASHRPGFF